MIILSPRALALVVALPLALAGCGGGGEGGSSYAAGLIALLAVVALIGGLAGLTYLIARLNLSRHPFALGLPSGSIRAVLAIALVVVFVMMTMFLFAGLSDGAGLTLLTKQPMSEADFAALRANLPDGVLALRGGEATADGLRPVRLYATNDEAGRLDFAKQLLTTLATALAVVIGFYFGARTATEEEPGKTRPLG